MNDMMQKMLDRKKDKGGEMSGVEKDAKMGVVKAMRDVASNAMNDKLKGLKKVSVASDSGEGLKAGLAKAQEMIGSAPEADDEPQAEDNEAMRSIDNHSDAAAAAGGHDLLSEDAEEGDEESLGQAPGEYDDMSEDEIDAKLQELMKMKASKQK